MSEPKPEYLNDALEMMGIIEPRQIVTEISGFVPVFEVVLHQYKDHVTALVFGRMWQYCGMSDGVCRASLEKIGRDLEISAATVMRHAEKLVADGYLIDTTPDRRNAPHEYLDGRRVEMKGRINAGIAERKPTVSQRNATVSESKLIKQDKTKIKQNVADATSIIVEEANKKVDAILGFEKLAHEAEEKGIWTGREMIPSHLLNYADWWHQQTGQTMKGKLNKEWVKCFTDWYTEELKLPALQEAFDTTKAWKKIIAKPSEITSAAVAIQALPKPNENALIRKEGQASGYFA